MTSTTPSRPWITTSMCSRCRGRYPRSTADSGHYPVVIWVVVAGSYLLAFIALRAKPSAGDSWWDLIWLIRSGVATVALLAWGAAGQGWAFIAAPAWAALAVADWRDVRQGSLRSE